MPTQGDPAAVGKVLRGLPVLAATVVVVAARFAGAAEPASSVVPVATEEAPPSPKPPAAVKRAPRAEATASIAGSWSGTIVRGKERYRSEWTIRQTGKRVTGEVTDTRIGGSGYARYRISGKVTGKVLWFRAEQWLTNRPADWCLPAGTLELSTSDGEQFLSGRWRANSVAGGCSGGRSANVKLSRGGQ